MSMFVNWAIVFSVCVRVSLCAPAYYTALEDDDNLARPEEYASFDDEDTMSEEDRALMRHFDG